MQTNTPKTPDESASDSSTRVDLFRDLVKARIRSEPIIPFHRGSLYEPFSRQLKDQLGGSNCDDASFSRALNRITPTIQAECPALVVHVRDRLFGVDIRLAKGAEWREVLAYAHNSSAPEAERALTPAAAELLERVENGELASQFRSEVSVRHRIRLFGSRADFPRVLEEIRFKRGIDIQMEEKGEKWTQRKHMLRFSIVSRHDPESPPLGYNPPMPGDAGETPTPREFRRWLLEMLGNSPFQGSTRHLIWSVRSRSEFYRCFPFAARSDDIRTDDIVRGLSTVRPHPFFTIGWNFGNDSCVWTVEVAPVTTWNDTRAALQRELALPTPEAEFGLTVHAAALYEWIRGLDANQLEFGLTPKVETARREQILLLNCPWSSENLRLFLSLLCEEISDRTALDLRVVEWSESQSVFTRIRVKRRSRPQDASCHGL